ncbi:MULTISPECIES: hypothetical protein [unclassified Mesorhizobium]|uniref:hypothetical protein n=1 Tax=unclassified Mesorhizobium TaxID=325217 RepID=UPI001093A2E5|nr:MULTISPECIES: hypothetical protein [unclassified Mesorhizobium]TGT91861.1 hypothetical protein EN804_01965 [Mesorhizobium sp. M8A.F.Ca.ET.161.01.1.1]TGV44886.1 hypothetical protein EN785_01960 [Mesorhizobium sp. M8A.F.Ca.ET.142.01.1.1]
MTTINKMAGEWLFSHRDVTGDARIWAARGFVASVVKQLADNRGVTYKFAADRLPVTFARPEFEELCPNMTRIMSIAAKGKAVTGNMLRNWLRECDLPDPSSIGFKEWLTAREIAALSRAGELPGMPTSVAAVERLMAKLSASSPHLSRRRATA